MNHCIRVGIIAVLAVLFSAQAWAAPRLEPGVVWKITLENEDVKKLDSDQAAAVYTQLPDPYREYVSAMVTTIVVVNKAGGEKGVEITGVGQNGIVVVPKGSNVYGPLKQKEKELEALGKKWLMIAGDAISRPGHTLEDWAKRIPGFGGGGKIALGSMHADGKGRGPYEKFVIVSRDANKRKVALLFHTGFLRAVDGGGRSVYADRQEIGVDEEFDFERNSDGTVSLKSRTGFYLTAINGGTKWCEVSRREVGRWEKFHLEVDQQGFATLKTDESGTYVQALPPK